MPFSKNDSASSYKALEVRDGLNLRLNVKQKGKDFIGRTRFRGEEIKVVTNNKESCLYALVDLIAEKIRG